jgi:hypothetical protein
MFVVRADKRSDVNATFDFRDAGDSSFVIPTTERRKLIREQINDKFRCGIKFNLV